MSKKHNSQLLLKNVLCLGRKYYTVSSFKKIMFPKDLYKLCFRMDRTQELEIIEELTAKLNWYEEQFRLNQQRRFGSSS